MKWTAASNPTCQLGEGVCWSSQRQSMMFVDIHGRRVHQYNLNDGSLVSWQSPSRIGWLIPIQGHDTWLAGFQEGMAEISLSSELRVLRWLCRPFEDSPGLRLNDAKADAMGRVWAGSLNNDDESQPLGALFCLTGPTELTTVDSGYCVANGPAISPDSSLMLHTDSARRTIYAFDFDLAGGTVSNKRVWKTFASDEGYPDGMNFDAQGHVWVAHWGAGCVSQFNQAGELLQRFKLPASNITNVAFGGPGLDRLFATSAWAGLPEAQRKLEPLAGALFEIHGHGAKGLPALQARL